jgi:hypothetical protein
MLRVIHQKSYLLPSFYWVFLSVFLTFQFAQNISFDFDTSIFFEQIDSQQEADGSGATTEHADEADFELDLSTHHLVPHSLVFTHQATQCGCSSKFFLSSLSKDIIGPPPQI